MNWTWDVRSGDGGMTGLEFARATTAGDFDRVLVHAAPAHLQPTVTGEEDRVVLRGEAGRQGDYSHFTLLGLRPPDGLTRSEIWPTEQHLGLPVLLPGGEVGVLPRWEQAEDRSWRRWAVEFSNHVGRPADWAPEDQDLRR